MDFQDVDSPANGPQTPTIEVYPPDLRPLTVNMGVDGKRKRVGFTSDTTPPSPDFSLGPQAQRQFGHSAHSSEESTLPGPSFAAAGERPEEAVVENSISDEILSREIHKAFGQPYIPKPSLRTRNQSADIELGDFSDVKLDGDARQRQISGLDAHDRAQRLAAKVGSYAGTATPSRRNSFDTTPEERSQNGQLLDTEHGQRRSGEDSDEEVLYRKKRQQADEDSAAPVEREATLLVRRYTQKQAQSRYDVDSPLQSGQSTPVADVNSAEDYIPKPDKYRGGVLASLLKLNHSHHKNGTHSPTNALRRWHADSHSVDDLSLTGTTPGHTPGNSPPASGTSTPTGRHHRRFRGHWPHSRHGSESPSSIAHLIGSSASLAHPTKQFVEETTRNLRPGLGKRSRSSEGITNALHKFHKSRAQEEIRITKHIAETLARHKYIVKLCRALMDYGAPTHRLEEYLKMSSRVLEIEAQFLYIPGCMLISFDDPTTHTTEVKLVRTAQGVDLGKLRDTHQIYKEVVHDQIDVNDAMKRLEVVMNRPRKFPVWFLVLVYGVAAASVGPFAFSARFIDLPMAFILGCILGWLQLVIAPRSDLYANIFEIAASVLTSFLARALGSIHNNSGGRYFCFSALAQSSIALILPGYTVLCASLELQSRSIVAGSVRMVYAIIYSLFLGYGITIGTVIYGWMDRDATSATTCEAPMEDYWFFFFVPVFTMCLVIINQAKWKQAPIMLVIAFSGYLVNFFSARRFKGNAQVTQTLGALTIGVEANLYARMGPTCENFFMRIWTSKIRPHLQTRKQRLHDSAAEALRKLESGASSSGRAWRERKGYGMAAAAMLPAIFVQVPSGLSVSGSLVSGITSADQIVNNSTGVTTVSSGSDAAASAASTLNGAAFTVSLSVIQIAIGITVGLFLSAVVVYPMGKRRSGLFSF